MKLQFRSCYFFIGTLFFYWGVLHHLRNSWFSLLILPSPSWRYTAHPLLKIATFSFSYFLPPDFSEVIGTHDFQWTQWQDYEENPFSKFHFLFELPKSFPHNVCLNHTCFAPALLVSAPHPCIDLGSTSWGAFLPTSAPTSSNSLNHSWVLYLSPKVWQLRVNSASEFSCLMHSKFFHSWTSFPSFDNCWTHRF